MKNYNRSYNDMEKHFTSSVIVMQDERFLLLWHRKLNTWLYPGGHIEVNETPDEAALREVKEETGLTVSFIDCGDFFYNSEEVHSLVHPYTILEEIVKDKNGTHIHIDIVYLAKVSCNNNIVLNKQESQRYGWFSLSDIETMSLLPNLKALLKKVGFAFFKKNTYKLFNNEN